MKTLIVSTALLLAINAFAKPVIPVGSPNTAPQDNRTASTVNTEEHIKFTQKDLWAVNGKLPPKPVLEFIEHPTVQTAKVYLEWNKIRAEHIDKAIAILEALKKEQQIKQIRKIPIQDINNSTIVMFFSPTCPHCLRELNVIKRIKTDYPAVGLKLYPVSNPFLAETRLKQDGLLKYVSYSKEYSKIAQNVSAVPFIVVLDKVTGKVKANFTGETSYEKIISSM